MTSEMTDTALPALFEKLQGTFDYGDIPQEEQSALEQHASAIFEAVKKVRSTTADCILRIGHELALAQQLLSRHGNGTFGRWCKDVCGCSRTTAYRCIAAYREFEDCPTVGQTFDASALYELSKPSCPAEAKQEAIELAEKGEHFSGRRAQEIVRKHAARQRPATVEPALDEPVPEAVGVTDIEQARKDVDDLVRELQRRSIPDSDIASILRRCAATLDPVESSDAAADGTDATAADAKPTSRKMIHIKRRKTTVHAPVKECDSEPAGVPRSTPGPATDAVVADEDVDKCDGCLGAKGGCKPTRSVTVEFQGIEYAAKVTGKIPLFRRSSAQDQGWTQAEGAFADAIRRAWQQRCGGPPDTVAAA